MDRVGKSDFQILLMIVTLLYMKTKPTMSVALLSLQWD